MEMAFPQYRKLGSKSYFRIDSNDEVTEIQKVGKRGFVYHLKASTFLDRNHIQDLLGTMNGLYTVIGPDEFEEVEKSVKKG